MKRKLLYGLLAIIACVALTGCKNEANDEKNGEMNNTTENVLGGIDLKKENVLLCTNLKRHINVRKSEIVESWQYVVEYDENDQDILSWKEVYTVDFSKPVNDEHDELVEYIESSFCKGRLNDVTEEGYEENKNLCQITNKGSVYTAVVTYPKKTIKHFVSESATSFNKETLKNELETGTYDGGFKGIYTCDKDFDHFTMEAHNLEREIQVKYLGSYEYGKEDALSFLHDILENATNDFYGNLLKQYKIDGSEDFDIVLKSEDGNDNYTYNIKLACYAKNKNDCENYMDATIKQVKEHENGNEDVYQVIK